MPGVALLWEVGGMGAGPDPLFPQRPKWKCFTLPVVRFFFWDYAKNIVRAWIFSTGESTAVLKYSAWGRKTLQLDPLHLYSQLRCPWAPKLRQLSASNVTEACQLHFFGPFVTSDCFHATWTEPFFFLILPRVVHIAAVWPKPPLSQFGMFILQIYNTIGQAIHVGVIYPNWWPI